jgi:hypothetical protein
MSTKARSKPRKPAKAKETAASERDAEQAVHDCAACQGKCCRYFALEIDKPTEFSEFDSIRWYLFHEANYVFVEKGSWYLCITTPCRNLDENFRCTIYDRRPLICREHDPSECEFDDEAEWDFEKLFRTPEQIEDYMRRRFGKHCFEREYEKYEKKRAKKAKKKGTR